jgi:hypothetical protein
MLMQKKIITFRTTNFNNNSQRPNFIPISMQMQKVHTAEKMEWFHSLVLNPFTNFIDMLYRPKPTR